MAKSRAPVKMTVPAGEAKFATPLDSADPPDPDWEDPVEEDVWVPEGVLLPGAPVLDDPEVGGVELESPAGKSPARTSSTLSTALTLSSEFR